MSNPGHIRPGALRPGFTYLPDGRGRMVVLMKLSNGEQLRNDLILAWGTLYSTGERVPDVSGRNSYLAGLCLVGGQETQLTAEGLAWVRIYEDIHQTNETQVGKLTYITDEDGRTRARAEFIQFSAATRTPGTPGTTTAPGAAGYVLATETATDDGALRRITRDYTQSTASASTAEAVGPVVISYPFNHLGDATHCIASQVYEQPATHYTPLTLNSTRAVTVGGYSKTLYYIGDLNPPSRRDAALVRFLRRWGSIPASRTEPEDYVAQFPGLIATNSTTVGYNGGATYFERTWNTATYRRRGFVRKVLSMVTYDFFLVTGSTTDLPNKLVATKEDIPLIPIQEYAMADKQGYSDYTQRSPLEISLSDVDTLNVPNVGVFEKMLTVPTRTEYYALGAFGLVVDCIVRRYEGNIYMRATRRVTPI